MHHVAHGCDYLPGGKYISVVPKYTWIPTMLMYASSPHLPHFPVDGPQPLYLDECGWNEDAIKCVTKEIRIKGKVDFGNIKIDEHPLNSLLILPLTMTKGIHLDFHVITPNEPPYALLSVSPETQEIFVAGRYN